MIYQIIIITISLIATYFIFNLFLTIYIFFKFSTYKQKEFKDEIIDLNYDEVFNVVNFNNWFCNPLNNAVYANTGIYLRLDKLSMVHIVDYLDKKWNVNNTKDLQQLSLYLKPFYDEIHKDWKNKLK